MSRFNAKQKKEYRQKLVQSLGRSSNEVEENKHRLKDRDETQSTDEQGPNSVADDMVVATLQRASGHSALIRKAIAKLDEAGESFGLCENCAKPIAKARLDKIPHASLCVHCQERIDAYQKKFGNRLRQISPSFEPQPDLFEPDPTLSSTDLD